MKNKFLEPRTLGLGAMVLTTFILGVNSNVGLAAAISIQPGTDISHDLLPGTLNPVFSHGVLLKLESNRTQTPELHTFNLQGKLLSSVPIRIPGASTVTIYAAIPGAENAFIVSGYAVDDDGRIATFIDFISQSLASNIVRTDPFAPRSLAMAADGTVWAAGNIYNHRKAPPDMDPSGGVLRHFDGSGKLIGSAFPQSKLNDDARTMTGVIAASRDRIGWVSSGLYRQETGWPGSYVEISNDGAQHEFPLPALRQSPGRGIVALALTDENAVFVTGFDPSGKLQIFQLDRGGRSWKIVSLPGFPNTEPFLFGASGSTLGVWASSDKRIRFFDIASGT